MAIYGVGAYYDHDVSDAFLENRLVGMGWSSEDAPELQEYFKSLKVGDIVYIKAAFGGADITVKGIGIIKDNTIRTSTDTNGLVTSGRNVEWLSTASPPGVGSIHLRHLPNFQYARRVAASLVN